MVSKFTDSSLDLSRPLSSALNYQSTSDLLNPLGTNAYSQSSSNDFANNLYINDIDLGEFTDGKQEKHKDNFWDRRFNPGKHEGTIKAKWTGKSLSWNDAPNKVWNKDSDIYNPWNIKQLLRVTNSGGSEKLTWTQ